MTFIQQKFNHMIFQRSINLPQLFKGIPLSVTSETKFTRSVVLAFLFNNCRFYFPLIFTSGNQRPIVSSYNKIKTILF